MIGAGLVRNFTQQISDVKAAVLAQLAAAAGATLVSFQASGAGAAVRTLWAVLMDRPVSVKNFGAKGDGATDDSAAIQAAIAAAVSAVVFPGGSYRLATRLSLANRSNVRLSGDQAVIVPDVNIGFLLIDTCDNVEVCGFKIVGTIDTTTVYLNNAEQGRIVPQNSTGVNIHSNQWNKTAAALFVQSGCDGVFFHHNRVIQTHAGAQTSSALFKNLWITDNYFEGHTFTNAIQGSDDQIAVFGNAGGQVVIERNTIDKKGPTAYNQARAIDVSVGAGASAEISVCDNIVKNVATTTAAQARAAIFVGGGSGFNISRVSVCRNFLGNCNMPVQVAALAANVAVSGNNIAGAVVLAGFANSGDGIYVNVGGADAEAVISGNLIQGCGQHGIDAASSGKLVISGNFVKGSTARGISLDTCNDVVLQGNLCTGNQDGAFVNNCQRIAVSGNVLTSNTRYGLRTQGATVSGTIGANMLKLNATADFSDASGTFDVALQANYGAGSYGLSSTSTLAKNLCGTATFTGTATKAVAFSKAEADASYRIALGSEANETVWVTNKTMAGFTLNSSNAASTAAVDWMLSR